MGIYRCEKVEVNVALSSIYFFRPILPNEVESSE